MTPTPDTSAGSATPSHRSPFTFAGLAVGGLLSLFVGLAAPFAVIMLQGSFMALNSSSPGAIFLFFVFTLFINTLLGAITRRLSLSRADLVLVYVMLLMAITVPTQAFVGYLIPVIGGLYYYATPENDWAELFGAHTKPWLVPQDFEVVRGLHEGLPPGESIPWEAWYPILGSWYAFFLALSFLMICAATILHRQWSQSERLAYPMVHVPLQMIGDGEPGRPAAFYRGRLMWLGFAIPMVIFGLSGLNHYFPEVPNAPFWLSSIKLFRGTVDLPIALSYAWIGFFYLVSLEISASIWFFYVLGRVEQGVFNIVGYSSNEQLSLYSFSQSADLTHQSMGACLVFVLFTLWMGRRHMRAVWQKVWDAGAPIDDREELLPYRVAVLGFLGSLALIGGWLWLSGIPAIILPAFLLLCLMFYYFVSRVVASAGVATARSPMVAAFVLISGIGTPVIGQSGLVALTMTYVWQSEMRLFPMIACANALKLADSVRGPKGRLFWGMLIALVCSLIAATWITLTLCYEYGGINLHPFFMTHQAVRTYTDMARPLLNPTLPDLRGWAFTAIGSGIEMLLMLAQHRFYWWPLHPVGFVVSVGWLTGQIWFSVFIAWMVKALILKYGGNGLFTAAKPLFLGLILGEASAAGFWLFVDWIAEGEPGNMITAM